MFQLFLITYVGEGTRRREQISGLDAEGNFPFRGKKPLLALISSERTVQTHERPRERLVGGARAGSPRGATWALEGVLCRALLRMSPEWHVD